MRGLALIAFLVSSLAQASVSVSVNGVSHTIPQTNERGWGNSVTAWIQAISTYTLQPSGGTFTLTADTDFGASYGLKSAYYKTRSSNPSTAGLLRLANSDSIGWRNNANGGNLLLTVNSSDQLLFNSVIVPTATSSSLQDSTFTIYDNSDATKKIAFEASGITTATTRTLTAPDLSGTIALTSGTQTLTGKTIDGDDNTVQDLANSAIKAAAAIDATKIADGSVTSTEFQYLGGVTSDIQTQLNSALTNPMDGAGQIIYGGASGTPTKLVAGTSSQVLRSGGAGAPSWSDVLISYSYATSGTKTPSASGHYHDHTNNTLTLSAGTYMLLGYAKFTSSGGSAAYSVVGAGFSSADGADTSSAPTALSSASNLTVLAIIPEDFNVIGGLSSAQDVWIQAPTRMVSCSASCTVYMTTYAAMADATKSRVTIVGQAVRLQ